MAVLRIGEEAHKDGTSIIHVHGELLEYNPYDCLFKIFHQRKILNGYVSELRFILQHHEIGVLLLGSSEIFLPFPQAQEIYAECVRSWNFIQNDLISTCLLTS